MARYVRPKKKAQARSGKKHTYNGVTFSSGLELFMWKELTRAGINAEYESESLNLCLHLHFQTNHGNVKQMAKVKC